MRYEAVHPIHIQHYLTKSWRERDRDGVWLSLVSFVFVVFLFSLKTNNHICLAQRPQDLEEQ